MVTVVVVKRSHCGPLCSQDGVRAFDVSKLPKGIASRGRGVRGRPGATAPSGKDTSSKKKEDTAPKKKVCWPHRVCHLSRGDPTCSTPMLGRH
jgi:hypothetical protein